MHALYRGILTCSVCMHNAEIAISTVVRSSTHGGAEGSNWNLTLQPILNTRSFDRPISQIPTLAPMVPG